MFFVSKGNLFDVISFDTNTVNITITGNFDSDVSKPAIYRKITIYIITIYTITYYLVSFCPCVFQSFEHCDYLAWRRGSAFRTFVRSVLVWICRFPLPLGVWEGLWFVIVALPGLFSYPFLC